MAVSGAFAHNARLWRPSLEVLIGLDAMYTTDMDETSHTTIGALYISVEGGPGEIALRRTGWWRLGAGRRGE